MRTKLLAAGVALSALQATDTSSVHAQELEPPPKIATPDHARERGLGALSEVPVPKPNLGSVVRPGKERELAQLGKMLFWDVAAGSDGMACASCHFHAGADNRTVSLASPGLLRVRDQRDGDVKGYHEAENAPDFGFESIQPGEAVSALDFPLVRSPGQVTRSGDIIGPAPGDSNDAMSSPGVIVYNFDDVVPSQPKDECSPVGDAVFNDAFGNVRRVPPRNTPPTINAVFNAFNFWDGRANPEFNGINPFGVLDKSAKVLFNESAASGGTTDIVRKRLSLKNSSLASQAVGPVLSDFEMTCADGGGHPRTWFHVGKKLLRTDANGNGGAIALATQSINRGDSLIGEYSRGGGTGSTIRYRDLIEEVFEAGWWKAGDTRVLFDPNDVTTEQQPAAVAPVVRYPTPTIVPATPAESADPGLVEGDDDGRYTLMEMNFSMFFGLAVQAYEQLLVSDDTPFDRWMRGGGGFVRGFGAEELAGLNVFVDEGKCINCHNGAEFTSASVSNFQNGNNVIEPMIMGNDEFALYDNGFYNIGVSPTVEDIGRGHRGPNDIPLASSRQRLGKDSNPDLFDFGNVAKIIGGDKVPNHVEGDPNTLICNDANGDGFCDESEQIYPEFRRAAVDGAFKTPQLRNVELTGPYFHNGSLLTLAQMVELYDNGGNFCDLNSADLDPDITSLGLSDEEKRQLVTFMLSLTDDRVRYKRGPFDHPSLELFVDGKEGATVTLRSVGSRGVGRRDVLRPTLNADHFDLGAMPTQFECSPSPAR